MTLPAPQRVTPGDLGARRAAVAALDSAVRTATGHEALGDAVWRDLDHPSPDSAGFFAGDAAYAHVARAGAGSGALGATWTAGLAVAPPGALAGAAPLLLRAVEEHVGARGGGRVTVWMPGAGDAADATFASAGWQCTRELLEMRVDLPLAETPAWPAGVRVRTFAPGRDEAEVVRVNNLAFAGHPEQGGWTEATLRGREGEAWFDPALFLLADDRDGVAGFDWLKLHPAREPDPLLGEIYVIGVDPRAQGTGLGRALAVEGMARVQARGAGTGMLFCAADNAPALALYRALGFVVHRTDHAYEREVVP